MARAVILALVLWAVAAAAPAWAQTPVERHGQLAVRDGRIVDQHGRPVVLRGMSLFWSQWQGRYYNAEAVRWLRDDWKVDVVRVAVGVEPDGYLRHPGREMRKAEAVIDAAIEAGLYVIVDWHAHQPEPEAAAAFFERIARRYGDRPNVIYEPWNEPLREHGWTGVVRPYHLAVVARIRAIDPDNLVVAGTPTWSQDVDVAAADPLPFTNLAYTLHFYAGTHRQELRDKAEAALARGAALMVTEWGTSEATGDGVLDEAETQAWWDFLETRQISYLNWSVADKPETASALKPGAAATGGWTDEDLTASGRLVRAHLRRLTGAEPDSLISQP
ncbi:glycoside hydrolase family 5 protein [Caulobacter sp. 17J80-11]|uniref:glycoside hydrolase family 5 protein n=1 Tax=Caulobacter sp. 17J80-11 TaxID=2763502 RepID=UPI001653DF05|nr:glycoside hydrolase family 5 protein [Caulobacter sp. 17J80-11]MBC6983410.1 glycoside hydrolase family 5 protein [Caulobacter sp. 17J80-11]